MKENEALRGLKDQDIKFKRHSDEDTMMRPVKKLKLAETSDIPDITLCSRKTKRYELLSRMTTINTNVPGDNDDQNNLQKDQFIINQEKNISCPSTSVQGLLPKNLRPPADNSVDTALSHAPIRDASFDTINDVRILKFGNKDEAPSSRFTGKCTKEDQDKKLPANVDDEVICYGDTNPVQTSVHIIKETGLQSPSPQPGKSSHLFNF